MIIGNDAPVGHGRRPARASCASSRTSRRSATSRPRRPSPWRPATRPASTGSTSGCSRRDAPPTSCLVDAPVGSQATTALEALRVGDLPGVSMVLIDGAVMIGRSRNTPPAARAAEVVGAAPAAAAAIDRRGSTMKFGLRLPSFALGAETASLADMGAYLRRAEDLGFEIGDAHRPPAGRAARLPRRPGSSRSRSCSALSGVTRTIRLGTLVLVLPFRDPVAFAKEWATLDVLSGGRSILGVGVGWNKEEFAALRIPIEERGRRMNEMLEAITALWAGDDVSYEGKFYRFEHLTIEPKPVQQPASADLDRRRHAAVREDLRPGRRHHPAGPAPDREVRVDVGAALLGHGRDGRRRLGEHPRLHGRERPEPGRHVPGVLELRAHPRAGREARVRGGEVPRLLGHGPRRTGRSSTCSARPRTSPSASAARSRPSAAWTT